jgi:hypothetical protein
MVNERLLEFEKVAKEEGVTMGTCGPLLWDKEKTIRITKHGAHSFAKLSTMQDPGMFRLWIKRTFPT